MKVEARAITSSVRCALCHGAFAADSWTCAACGTQLHMECLASVAKCPTLGCRPIERAAPVNRPVPSARPKWSALRRALRVVAILLAIWCVRGLARSFGVWPFGPLRSWVGHGGHVHEIVFSGDECETFVIARLDDGVRAWNLDTGRQTGRLDVGGEGLVAPPARRALVCGTTWVSWNPEGVSSRTELPGLRPVDSATDGSRLFVAQPLAEHRIGNFFNDDEFTNPTIVTWPGRDARLLPLDTDRAITHAAWCPDGRSIAAIARTRNAPFVDSLLVWNAESEAAPRVVREWKATDHDVTKLAWRSPEAALVLRAYSAAGISVDRVHVPSGRVTETIDVSLPYPLGPARTVFTFALGAHFFAAGHVRSGLVTVFSVDDGSIVAERRRQDCQTLRFSPDERLLAVGSSTDVDVYRITWW